MHSPGPKIRVGLHGRHLGVDLLREGRTKGGEEIVELTNRGLSPHLVHSPWEEDNGKPARGDTWEWSLLGDSKNPGNLSLPGYLGTLA